MYPSTLHLHVIPLTLFLPYREKTHLYLLHHFQIIKL